MKTPLPRIKRTLLWLCILALAVGVAAYAYSGTFTRLWADDYCYSSTVQQYGLLQGIGVWYQASGSRFSALPVVALTDLLGVWGVRLFPAFVLGLWVLAGTLLLRGLARACRWQLAHGWTLFFGLLLTFFAAYLAPDALQTISWRMGVIHYSLPAPIFLLLLALLLRFARAVPGRMDILRGALVLLLAAFNAGFSETFAALQTGALLLILLPLSLHPTKNRRGLWLVGAALLGTLLAMGILALSPSNEWRQAALPPPESLWQLIAYTLRYSFAFLYYSFIDQPLPNVIFAGLAALVAFLAAPAAVSLRPSRLLGGMLVAILATLALVICATAPSVYGGLAAPAGRALMPSRFIWLLGLGALAALAGLGLRQWLARWKWTHVAALLLLLGLCLYPLRGASLLLNGASQSLAVKAERWDARHAQILQDRQLGIGQIQTVQTDVVQGLEDYGPDAAHWINQCAADYYAVESITAR